MTKQRILAAIAVLALSAGTQTAHAAPGCPDHEVRGIQQKFDERLSYEARRAQRRKMPTTAMINGFGNVDRTGSCAQVFERHRVYLDRWASKIDRN
ncbi:MAG: hypothetical protein AAF526_12120 [Pseudomonadota bacterium]